MASEEGVVGKGTVGSERIVIFVSLRLRPLALGPVGDIAVFRVFWFLPGVIVVFLSENRYEFVFVDSTLAHRTNESPVGLA